MGCRKTYVNNGMRSLRRGWQCKVIVVRCDSNRVTRGYPPFLLFYVITSLRAQLTYFFYTLLVCTVLARYLGIPLTPFSSSTWSTNCLNFCSIRASAPRILAYYCPCVPILSKLAAILFWFIPFSRVSPASMACIKRLFSGEPFPGFHHWFLHKTTFKEDHYCTEPIHGSPDEYGYT